MTHSDLTGWITSLIRDFCDGPENSLQKGTDERAWDTPFVGFANGADPMFAQLKMAVGDFHWTPGEIFAQTFPDLAFAPEELTVIVYILPQTEATRCDQRAQTVYPAERWARTRFYGEYFNRALRDHVAAVLNEAGYPAVAPSSAPHFRIHDSERYTFASTWSERHAAHAAGLGTFGLSDGLITLVGKAHRLGSIVARISIPATPRPYTDHHAYCPWYTHNACGLCIARCPVGALSAAGHDKIKCRDHLDDTRPHILENYGFAGYACGLCQVGVPCESGIPDVNLLLERELPTRVTRER
ncbi:MAG: epoxyqueuosine reductase [Anaerolineae bacterium]